MKDVKIPEGYQQVMPYLIVKDAAAFMDFMKTVFGATEKYKMMRDEQTIMHAEAFIGNSVIMFAETIPDYPVQNANLFIYVADGDETFQKALAAGATEVQAMSNKEYGRTGGIKDPFGNTWWVTAVG